MHPSNHRQSLAGRRFLICHSIVHDLIGSTIVALDLATHLVDEGAEVVVYAAFIGDPAMTLFRDRRIEVVDDHGMEGRAFSDFDVVWVHSQVLPERMVDEFVGQVPERMPDFVFLHMSAQHFAPDEHPYIHELESRLSSLSLFISSETRRLLMPHFDGDVPTALYPNPTPVEFAQQPYAPRDAPASVLVVSNHATPELMEAKQVLRDRGLLVRHVGSTGEGQQLVSADLLDDVDVVVTIGKTVQYALVSGRPVYVYDRFGGYGYLDDDQLAYAQSRNFSGRGGRRLSAEQIADEIVTGYADAVLFGAAHREEFVEAYSIDRVLPRVLAERRARTIEPFPTSYHRMVRSAQSFGARFFHYWGHNANEVRNRQALTRDLEHERSVIESLLTTAASLRVELEREQEESARARAMVVERDRQIDRIHRSWTFRIGRRLVRPISLLRGVTRRLVAR